MNISNSLAQVESVRLLKWGSSNSVSTVLRTEIIRKSIHVLIALVPILAHNFGRVFTSALLIVGILIYTIAESLRCSGKRIPVISYITEISSRHSDKGHFVLAPVTLGIGALLALTFYPEPAATVGILALAFGDSISSLVGMTCGRLRIPLFGGKSLEGSFACLTAVFLSSYALLQNALQALLIAIVTTILELIPTKDFDNIILPLGTGLFTILIFV